MNNKFEQFSNANNLKLDLQEKYSLDSGFEINSNNPIDDSIEVLYTEKNIIVGFIHYDNDPQPFFENNEGAGQLITFRSQEAVDKKLQELSKTKKLFYIVNKYEHSNVHYSISGSKLYPDERWDVSHGCGVFIPCEDIQSQFRKLKKEKGIDVAYDSFIVDSNNVLNEYSNWCNGEVYGYSVITFDQEGNEIDCDECYGFIGNEYVQEEKQSVMKQIAITEQLNKIMKNVLIETVEAKDIKLPFKINKKDLKEIKFAHVYDSYCVAAKYAGEDNAVIYNWKDGDEKPTKAKFSNWQKERGTTAEQFLTARLNSDIKDVLLQKIIKEEEPTLTNKVKP